MEPHHFTLMGFGIIVLGMIVVAVSSVWQGESKGAVVGFIGPLPFGFGNDGSMLMLAVTVGFFLMVGLSLVFRFFM